MARLKVSPKDKEFIRWTQKDQCLICSFPLVLYCHLHHIITSEDGGPEDPLNLVGMCANHHGMLESLKKTKDPDTFKLGTDDRNTNKWIYKATSTLNQMDKMNPDSQKIFNILIAPYRSNSDKHLPEILKTFKPSLRLSFAQMLIKRDIELLNSINVFRPRIFFPKPMLKDISGRYDPYDLLLINDKEIQNSLDEFVSESRNKITDDSYNLVIALHLIKIGFLCDHQNGIVKFHFPSNRSYSVPEIRDMSQSQIFDDT